MRPAATVFWLPEKLVDELSTTRRATTFWLISISIKRSSKLNPKGRHRVPD